MSTPAPSAAMARVLVDEMARAGVSTACLAPGSRSTPLALALAADPRIAVRVELDERSAAFFALGVGKAARRPALAVATSGTASVNFHPAVAEADHARAPLLVATADRPRELHGTAANQTIDQRKLFGDAVRWSVELGLPERPAEGPVGESREAAAYWRSAVCRAVSAACGAPPGPVQLNCAFPEPLVDETEGSWGSEPGRGAPAGSIDDAAKPDTSRRGPDRPWTAVPTPPRPPADDDIATLAGRIRDCPRGLIVVGDTPTDPVGAFGGVLALAEAAGYPVLAEPTGNARCGPLAISTAHALLSAPGFAAAHRPDLVVRIGKPGLSRQVLGFLDDGIEQILIDADTAWLDPSRTLSRIITADPSAACTATAARLEPRAPSDWLASWTDAELRARTTIDRLLDAEPAPSEPRTARDLAALAPDGAALVAASSMPVRDLDAFMTPRDGLWVVGNRGASGIDGFLSTALGVAASHPGPALALAGDLSVLHDQNGLLLAERDRIDLTVVVANNDGGGIFSLLPQAGLTSDFEPLFGTAHGIDFAALARMYGCGHARIGAADELVPAVEAARTAGGLQMVEVATDREANAALHRRVLQAVAEELG
jgi:2-succinyl-5-enolpyruvyl-6-hydroxy-3-cyclohexene-1-carboxylate synthase